jgi:hypothetical protein
MGLDGRSDTTKGSRPDRVCRGREGNPRTRQKVTAVVVFQPCSLELLMVEGW